MCVCTRAIDVLFLFSPPGLIDAAGSIDALGREVVTPRATLLRTDEGNCIKKTAAPYHVIDRTASTKYLPSWPTCLAIVVQLTGFLLWGRFEAPINIWVPL